jgi:hypothetical protein
MLWLPNWCRVLPQAFPTGRAKRLFPSEPIGFEDGFVQVYHVLILAVTLAVVLIPFVVFAQKQPALLQRASKATGTGAVHAKNAQNTFGTWECHKPMSCSLL